MSVVEDKHLQYRNLQKSKIYWHLKFQKKVKKTASRCENELWVELSKKIQLVSNTVNNRVIYVGLNKAIGLEKEILCKFIYL